MTRLDRFNKRLNEVSIKFNNNIILIDDIEYARSRDNIKFKCIKHNIEFISSINILTDKRVTCGCPICKQDKQLESSIKGVEARKKLRGI